MNAAATIPREVLEALRAFRAANGRNWKSALLRDWDSGKDSGALRVARNILGPSGLLRVKL